MYVYICLEAINFAALCFSFCWSSRAFETYQQLCKHLNGQWAAWRIISIVLPLLRRLIVTSMHRISIDMIRSRTSRQPSCASQTATLALTLQAKMSSCRVRYIVVTHLQYESKCRRLFNSKIPYAQLFMAAVAIRPNATWTSIGAQMRVIVCFFLPSHLLTLLISLKLINNK